MRVDVFHAGTKVFSGDGVCERNRIPDVLPRRFLEALLLLLENRFGNLPTDVRHKVERINSSQRINELLVAVLNGKSLSELGL